MDRPGNSHGDSGLEKNDKKIKRVRGSGRSPRGHFGRTLYEVRKRLGMTQGQIGKIADVAVSMVSRYEKGVHEPDFQTAALLTTAMSLIDENSGRELTDAISEEMGATLAERIISTTLAKIAEAAGDRPEGDGQHLGTGVIPCTTRVSGDPDNRIEWEEEIPDDPVEFGRDVRAARVVGESMEPIARDGQRILYSLEAKVRDGDLVVVRPPHSYRKLFKRFRKAPGGHALFESVDHGRAPLFCPLNELDGRMWKVVGVVF